MLQSYSSESEFDEVGGRGLGLRHYLNILKGRAFYFAGAFSLILLLGAFVTAIQRPLYQAEGKVLVESQEIPADLVQPTITDPANERIQVIQQRIMTRDNLLAIVKKYGMFAKQREWMSETQILDLMRQRTTFSVVDLGTATGRPGTSTIAFTVSFEYENPGVTLQVTNDLLTLILNEDARSRANRATETTEFLARESQRLQDQLAAIDGQIAKLRAQPEADLATSEDPARLQIAQLTRLKEELAEKSSTYSDQHPVIIALKKKIAAMEKLVAQTPVHAVKKGDKGLFDLERRRVNAETALELNNKKLETARLGERLEKDQVAQRLQVIEQPVLPEKPIKPDRRKLLAISFALAIAAGFAAIFAAESLDGSIRYGHQLAAVANGRFIFSIPYITTRAETFRRRSRIALVAGTAGAGVLAGVVGFLFFGPPIDLSWVHQFWLDRLTSL
jgi:protein tyrosine kinase modulator